MRAARPSRAALCALVAAAAVWPLAAQGFGFGADEAAATEDGSPGRSPSGLAIGGSVDFAAVSFFESADEAADSPLQGDALGRLSVEAKGSSAEAALKLRLSRAIITDSPGDILDEAYARAFAGPLTLEGGLLKLAWGKADSLGPLNVLNPMDYTDLRVRDEREQRIAQPMVHASLALGDLSKLELAFLPGFEGDRYAWEGRWTPKAIASQKKTAYSSFYYGSDPTANGGQGDGLYYSYYATAWSTAYAAAYSQAIQVYPAADAASAAATAAAAASCADAATASAIASQAAAAADSRVAELLDYPDTHTLKYAQGGLRFTTTLGSVDLGLQYFYGFLPRPAASADPAAIAADGYRVPVSYDRYHQAGADFAAVALGFNLRAELAANLTEDIKGSDPAVYNPELAFSAGFDRGLFGGLSLNLQYAGTYRLMDDAIDSAYDVEAGSGALSTRLTAVLSRSFLKDDLELKLTGIWGVQDRDCLVMPSVTYKLGEAELELAARLFAGAPDGELGQYAQASYAEAGLKYKF